MRLVVNRQTLHRGPHREGRPGAATVEFAIVLPILMFFFLVTVDYCRIFYFSQVVDEAARTGGLWIMDPTVRTTAGQSSYADVTAAARGSAPSWMRSDLAVSTGTGSDTSGSYTYVQVTYTFKSITKFPWIPDSVDVTRKSVVRPIPQTPRQP